MAEAAPGLLCFLRFLALVNIGEEEDAGLQLGAATAADAAAVTVGAAAVAISRWKAARAAAWA